MCPWRNGQRLDIVGLGEGGNRAEERRKPLDTEESEETGFLRRLSERNTALPRP